MDCNTACADYLKRTPAYRRMMEAMGKKYQGLGRVGGAIRILDATQGECDAARALFGRAFSAPLRVSLAEFEDALQQTPYQGVTLPLLLSAYFGAPVYTKAQLRHQKEEAYQHIFAQAGEGRTSEVCRRWLTALAEANTSGTGLVQQVLSGGTAATVLRQVCESVEWLETHGGQPVRLAVLSARVTSDPHALDAGTTAGKLLLHLLAFRSGRQPPGPAEERIALYFEGGILCDSISSTVTQTGLVLTVDGTEHPAFAAFRARRESGTLTLTNLAALTGAYSPAGRAYLVENEMVYAQLCDSIAAFQAPLICTSGQLEVAALRLLDLLAASGTALFYSGDFDVGGLNIAARLMRRYPKQLELWHMTPEDYSACISEVPVDETRVRGMESRMDGPLAALVSALGERGRAGYQELLLPRLHRDLTTTP